MKGVTADFKGWPFGGANQEFDLDMGPTCL